MDFRGLLAEGREIEDAVIEAARANNLMPEVVRVRVERAFGDLNSFQNSNILAELNNVKVRDVRDDALAFVDGLWAKPRGPYVIDSVAFWRWANQRQLSDVLRDTAWSAFRSRTKFHEARIAFLSKNKGTA
jgi:hypothetical protein